MIAIGMPASLFLPIQSNIPTDKPHLKPFQPFDSVFDLLGSRIVGGAKKRNPTDISQSKSEGNLMIAEKIIERVSSL